MAEKVEKNAKTMNKSKKINKSFEVLYITNGKIYQGLLHNSNKKSFRFEESYNMNEEIYK